MTAPFAPLASVRIIDLSRALAGPHAAMLLGDLGAHVIKVEAPGTGDDTRAWGPPFIEPDAGDPESTYFLSCNRNKESISLDLKSEPDAATLAELIRWADVLFGNSGTAAFMPLIEHAGLRPGETVLVLGATGAVGQLAVQIAHRHGAARVIGVARDRVTLERLLALGADAVAELREGAEELAARLLAATGPVDVVLVEGAQRTEPAA